MSSTFLRGLRLLEIVGLNGPIGVSELARRLDTDKGSISRMVSVAAVDGWLVRSPDGIRLGPRLPVLGYDTAISAAIREIQPVVDAVAGVTGLFTQVCGLIGSDVVAVLSAGRAPIPLPGALAVSLPLWSSAVGRALAVDLGPDELSRVLPAEPFPEPTSMLGGLPRPPMTAPVDGPLPGWRDASSERVTTRRQLQRLVDEVRSAGVARERGEVLPSTGCVAVPWPDAPIAASIGVIGPVSEVVASSALAETVLRVAVEPGADRARVIAAAMGAING